MKVMKKWIVALLCAVLLGAAAGGAATWREGRQHAAWLEEQGCNLIVGNRSESAVYGVTVRYLYDGQVKEAVYNRVLPVEKEACFALDTGALLKCQISFQTADRQVLTFTFEEEFEEGTVHTCWLTGKEGDCQLQYALAGR